MDDYTLTDTETEPVRAKLPDSTTRFCCAAAIASLTAFFCLKKDVGKH